MGPSYTAGRYPSRERKRSKFVRRSSSRTRSQSPHKTPRCTAASDFRHEVGVLGSGLLKSSFQTCEVPNRYVDYGGQSDVDEDSKRFISLVKDTFHNDLSVYRKFVHIISQVQHTDTDKLELVKQVVILFDGYPHLILGFNAFLPNGYSIEIQNDIVVIRVFQSGENLNSIDTGHIRCYNPEAGEYKHDALAYIQQVKKMYADDPYRYKTFREILKEYHSKKVNELETIQRIVSLFHKYPYLIEGFSAFLPRNYHIYLHDHSYDIQYPGDHEGEVTIVNFKKEYGN